MGFRVDWVSYGRNAAEALRAAVAAAKGGEPLAPVTVVVPSNHVGVATRRLLASGELGPVCGRGLGLAAVTFATPYRLAELLAAPRLAARGLRPVSTPVIAAALREALRDRPGVFAPVAAHPATETALVDTYRELRDLSEGALDALARASPRARDIVHLHRHARRRLCQAFYDEEDLMEAATAVIAGARDLGPIVVYLPQRLSRHATALLDAAGSAVLAGTTGDPRADGEVAASIGSAPPPGNPWLPAPGATRVLTASDADDEVRAAVRAVIDAARGGTPLDRIAILHASPEPYARLAHEQLSAAGIPSNGAAVLPLSARVAGRHLLHLLALSEGNFRREDVFAWLAGAPVRGSVTAWERLSRDAGVVAGREQWDHLLARLAAEWEASADQAALDPDAPDWRADHDRDQARKASELRSFVLGRIDDLAAAAASPRSWSDHARWAHRQLRSLGRGRFWPDAEVKAAERVEAALDRLATLDRIEGPVGVDVFARTLELELSADLGRVGRFGEGVLVGSVAMGIGLDLDLVIVLGLAEGMFPAPVRDDSLLPDHERQLAGGELAPRKDRVEREHRQLLAALAGARRHLLCVPRGDLRRSSEHLPSRWVLGVASALDGRRCSPRDLVAGSRPWLTHVASFDAGLRHLDFPATEQEHHLRSLLAEGDRGTALLQRLSPGAEVVACRRSPRFTRFDGNLSGLPVPSPARQATSATRLERWAVCPFAYFVAEILGVDAVENPEDQLEIAPVDRGSLVHAVLERFILEVLDRPAPPRPEQPWTAADRRRILAIAGEVCDDYEAHGLTGRPIFWRRDRRRIEADLLRFLDEDDEHRREHATRPIAAELAFGLRGAPLGPVALALPDGREVLFRGKADRVDVAADGALHVVDYKTGRSSGYDGLSEDQPDQQGRRLQLAVYAAAARRHHGTPATPVLAEYWFVSAKGRFVRRGYNVTAAVQNKVSHTLAAMVAGIEAGTFPSYPTASSTTPTAFRCDYCEPDGLGVADLVRQWERKRDDPALAVFAGLAEPPETEAPNA